MIRRPQGRPLSRAELELAAVELLRHPEAWQDRVVVDPGGTRTYVRLELDEHVEAWLICWSPGHDTGFHDHDRSLGAVGVARGRVREETLVLGGEPVVREIGAGGVFSFDATDIHRVLHLGGEPAVTLHLYSPPLRAMGAYEVRDDGRLARTAIGADAELSAVAHA
jgi:predicted metal-dependent enzyme (double-stranded beta helix superfamily)